MRTKCITSAKSKKYKSNPPSDDFISIILLCDSPGYRMKSYGPISLINIDNKVKLIDKQIEAIVKTFNNYEIILCLGFDANKVYKYVKSKYTDTGINIRVVLNQLYDTSNTCESLRLSLANVRNNKILVCDGNLLINEKILKLININQSSVIIEENSNHTLEIGLNANNNYVQYFSFGAKKIWSEIIYFNGSNLINNLMKIILNYENKNKFMFEAFNDLLTNNSEIFKIITNPKRLIKINNIKTYHKLKESK